MCNNIVFLFCFAACESVGSAWQRKPFVGRPGATLDACRDMLATAGSVFTEPRVLGVRGRVTNVDSE